MIRQPRKAMVLADGIPKRISMVEIDSGLLATRMIPRMAQKSLTKSSSSHLPDSIRAVQYNESNAASALDADSSRKSASSWRAG